LGRETIMSTIEFQKVRNKDMYLALDEEGETLGRCLPTADGQSWQAKIAGGPSKEGFSSGVAAQCWVQGFYDGQAHAKGAEVASGMVAEGSGDTGGDPEGDSQAGAEGAATAAKSRRTKS
jgi:hypothetical protein